MARANTRTLLPLDRWASILGLEPRHFNGVQSDLAPVHACNQVWLQYSWQDADRVGREDVAQAIAQAEADVITALGFLPVPDWASGEVVRTTPPHDPGSVLYGLNNVRGYYPSIYSRLGRIISGGIRAVTLISTASIAGFTMTWQDLDGDGYEETMRIIVPTTVTDTNEIRVFFPSHSADELWEIRPLRSVSISGGNVTVLIDRHLLVDPDLWEAINAEAVDGDVDANFVSSLGVYRIYNDISEQATLRWERIPGGCDCGLSSCPMCSWTTQAACLQVRDPRLPILTYQPAIYDEDTDSFTSAALTLSRQPDQVSLSYYSGWQGQHLARPLVQMDSLMERIITLYSVTLLDRPICACDNVENYIARWREDRALIANEGARYQLTDRNLSCPWGTREGAVWAWGQVQRYALGQGVRR